jgi:ribonuclease J
MGRLARGRHHRLRVEEGDTIVFSAYPIPGNEETVYRTINQLYRRGANVLYEKIANVHVSGHASQEEMKLMINLVRPKFLIPVHGELRHLKQHAEMAADMGMSRDNIAVIENGTPIELDENRLTVLPRMRGGYIFVDGSSVGDIGWPIVRDREKLANSGIFFAVITLNDRGDVIGKPDIVTLGFIAKGEAPDLMEGAEVTIANTAQTYVKNRDAVHKRIAEALTRYLYAETGRRPLVHVVIKSLVMDP